MRCHRHRDAEAIGACLHCGRGVCADCDRATSPVPLNCSDACAEVVYAWRMYLWIKRQVPQS